MDPDFRLEALPLSPALDTSFRTCTAFSSAWVRSSSSPEVLGAGCACCGSNTVICHHCPSCRCTQKTGQVAEGYLESGPLHSSLDLRLAPGSGSRLVPCEDTGSKTPASSEPSGRAGRGKDTDNRRPGSGRWARPPGPVSERGSEGPGKA